MNKPMPRYGWHPGNQRATVISKGYFNLEIEDGRYRLSLNGWKFISSDGQRIEFQGVGPNISGWVSDMETMHIGSYSIRDLVSLVMENL